MRTITSFLASSAVLALSVSACEQAPSSLTSHSDYWATSAATQHNPAPSHMAQLLGSGMNGITDPETKVAEDAILGTPDQVARMHGTQKIQYAMLGTFLADLGVNMSAGSSGSGSGSTTPTAAVLYASGSSALGAPIYPSRTPEMVVPSTSALAKQYDIFMAAAPEIIANIGSSTRCPGVVLIANGDLTSDGISCLIGKPALPDHVTLAQQLVASASDPATGQQIAVATLLAAAHISE